MREYTPFQLESSWKEALEEELQKGYVPELALFVEEERRKFEVFPPKELVFNALQRTSYDGVRVVIVGQDPYHGPGQAHGLSFSVPEGVPPPPSLKNIYKELIDDVGIEEPKHGCLLHWASQGVLLLNTVLTVRRGEANSHKERGWEQITDAIISALMRREEPLIFLLWGRSAQDKCELTGNTHHIILKAPHPSPFSAHSGFFGCKHFSKTNEILKSWDKEPIDWSIQ